MATEKKAKDNRKAVLLRMPRELHGKTYAIAAVTGKSLNETITMAVTEFVERNEGKVLELFDKKMASPAVSIEDMKQDKKRGFYNDSTR